MRKSEIFENFVKIAQERGLVSSENKKPEHTEKDFSETNPRFDSLTIEQISKLYNTKPALPKDMEYKRNIIENAHPESVVVSPSYDKLNGLVENENEGQAIRARIVMKEPDGHLINRKYARKNLLLSLVRVGNELDARNNEELRKLADVCLVQTSAPLKKSAVPVVPIVIGVAALVGAIYAYEHITSQEGLRVDYQKLTDQITKLQRSSIDFGVGYELSDEFKRFLADLLEKERTVNDAVAAFQTAMSKSSMPKTKEELARTDGKEIIDAAKSSEGQEITAAFENLKKVTDNMSVYLTKVHQNLKDPGFRERAVKDRGALTGLVDKIPFMHDLQSKAPLFNNFFDELIALLENYEKDVAAIQAGTAAGKQQQQNFTNNVTSDMNNPQTPAAPAPGTPNPSAPPAPAKEDPGKNLEDEAKSLLGPLGGLF
jgi:hypothetical protein